MVLIKLAVACLVEVVAVAINECTSLNASTIQMLDLCTEEFNQSCLDLFEIKAESVLLLPMSTINITINEEDSFNWIHCFINISFVGILTVMSCLFGVLFQNKLKQFDLLCTRFLCLSVVIVCFPVSCENDPIFLTEKVTASDYQDGDQFGRSVAISENFAIVGATNNVSSGSAYIFERNVSNGSWVEIQKLVPSDADARDNFGGWKDGVAISGNYAIIGAYSNDDNGAQNGSAYIFERNMDNGSWIEKQKLIADDSAAEDYFGFSVDIDANYGYAIVGAYGNVCAYIFEKQDLDGQWIQVTKLTAFDGEEDDGFGRDVSISGNYAIVGAHLDDNVKNGVDSGSAYIFERSEIDETWNLTNKLIASDGDAYDEYGYAVSIFGDYAIVGAYQHDYNGRNESGRAYIYKLNSAGTWTQKDTLAGDDAAEGARFGHDVSLNKNYVIVGAFGDDNKTGSAYIFRRLDGHSIWNQYSKLVVSDEAVSDQFGWSVAISEDNIVIIGDGKDAAYFDGPYATHSPSRAPSNHPVWPTDNPSNHPTKMPTNFPTTMPSNHPTTMPSDHPTKMPSKYPSIPSYQPSNEPSYRQTSEQSSDNDFSNESTESTESTDDPGSKKDENISTNAVVMIVGSIVLLFVLALGVYLGRRSFKHGNSIPVSKENSYVSSPRSVPVDQKTPGNNVKYVKYVKHVKDMAVPGLEIENGQRYDDEGVNHEIVLVDALAISQREGQSMKTGMDLKAFNHGKDEEESLKDEDEQQIEIESFKKTIGNPTPAGRN